MPYQSGTAASFADLHSTINTFLQGTPGYTLNGNVLTKSGTQIHAEIVDDPSYITLAIGKSSTGAVLENLHPLRTISVEQRVAMADNYYDNAVSIVFPINYEFFYFSSPVEFFRVVIEYNNGYHQNLGFGEIVKATDIDGGVYADGSGCPRSNGAFDVDITALTWTIATNNSLSTQRQGANPLPFGQGRTSSPLYSGYPGGSYVWAEFMSFDWFVSSWTNIGPGGGGKYDRGPGIQVYPLATSVFSEPEASNSLQTYNANNVLVPIRLFATQASGNVSRLGDINDIRWTNIKHRNPGEIITIGPDKWKCYPAFLKDASQVNGTGTHSGQIGYAVRYDGP